MKHLQSGSWAALAAFLLLSGASGAAVEYFPLRDVRLLDSPFRAAQDRDIDYLLAMDADRLLAPYLREAGLEPKAASYGNWESSGLDGHIGGHYLSALSLAWASTGRDDVRERLAYVLDELKRAQDANGDGYLGGVPNGHELWAQIADGDVRADLFGLNGAWVPWYNLHKIFAGLRDAWVHAGSAQARDMLVAWADWAAGLVANLSDGQLQAMLRTEHGGMNEVFADVAAITGEARYLALAERFSHREILEPLIDGEDRLTGLHANTQIPKVTGFERIAALRELPGWHRAAAFFWDTVVNERSVAIGGNSVREHFHDKADFEPMLQEVEGPETCNTYNMLRLTRLLYRHDPGLQYVAYYERALYNHILSSQDPATGGLVYFTPMRPQHYRVYSTVHDGMWCCVGSGIENHVRYGEFIYARDGNDLYVNLYIPSRLEWHDAGLSIRQETAFPDESATRIVFERDTDVRLKLRYPAWAGSERATVRINGREQRVEASPGSYIELDESWQSGDIVELALPMRVGLERPPDGADSVAILYGPIVLAAETAPFAGESLSYFADDSRMGHIPGGDICPVDRVPVFVADDTGFAERIERVDGNELRFQIPPGAGLRNPTEVDLVPFFRVHRTRYMLYWPLLTPEQLAARRDNDARTEAAQRRLQALTLDSVSPGEQQPEVEHDYAGVDAEAGSNFGRHWRHAAGWFGYTLADPDGEARFLRIDYWGADRDRSFRIEMNGVPVADVTLSAKHGAEFVSIDYPLDDAVRAAASDGSHRLRFVAAEGSVAGGIYGVRLLRALPDTTDNSDTD